MPRPRPATLLLRAATVVSLLVIAACSGGSSDEVDWSPLPRVAYDVPAPVADRDRPSVQRTLATVDPCGLLDRAALIEAGVPRVRGTGLEATSPSECYVGNGLLYVRLYESLTTDERYSWARTQVGNHLAFTEAREERGGCRAALPVDLDHVVMVASLDLRCPDVLAAAGVVADRLDAADVALRPAGLVRSTACGLAAAALGVPTDSPRLEPAPNGTDASNLDDCTILSAPDAPIAPSIDVSLLLGPPVERLLADDGYRRVAVGAQDVAESGGRRSCFLHADLPGAVTDTTYERSALSLQVHAGSCRAGETITARLLRAAAEPSVMTGPVLPVADLLLGSGDPASPLTGACADLMPTSDGCVPLDEDTDVEVPDDPVQVLRQGEADPAVICAAAAGAVRDTYGESMAPTVVSGSTYQTCTFAGPDHVVEVEVEAVTEAGARPLDTTTGGHPADLTETDSPPSYAVRTWTIALTGADDPGQLVVSVTCVPEPGAISTASYDPACVGDAEGLADTLASSLLG